MRLTSPYHMFYSILLCTHTLLKEAAFEGTLPADTLELRVVNGEAFALPKTGSTGFVRIPMATVFCLMLCAANLWLLRKKEQ